MKSRLPLLIALLCLLTLAACASHAEPSELPSNQPRPTNPNRPIEVTRVAAQEAETVFDAAAEPAAGLSAPNSHTRPTDGQPFPAATPDSMFFEPTDVNPYVLTIDDRLSTFAIDVDTGSYTLMRSYLDDYRQLPPPEAVRPEEYINYFNQQYAIPQAEPFAIYIDGAPAPFAGRDSYHLVRVGIQGTMPRAEERPPVLLIFVIDTSGSMDREDRLGLVKESLRLLVDALHPDDRVGIVEYGSRARVVLSPTAVRDRQDVLDAVYSLRSSGSTNVEDGIREAYRLANRFRLNGDITRLIVLSDGVANVGRTASSEILQYARDGISLSTFGFGMGNYNDALMEQLANDGDGIYAYIDTLREAQRLFVTNLTSTLVTIAKDAKIQVEFDPAAVIQYRLIGYENRDVADNDFRNDSIDAGEVGAGHSVTALYEIRLADDVNPEAAALTVRVRYQDPDSGIVNEISRSAAPEAFARTWTDAPATFQLSAVVAEFAELLRGSYWSGDISLADLSAEARRIQTLLSTDSEVTEFATLVRLAATYQR